MANGKIHGKQIQEESISLSKLANSGSLILTSPSQLQITGTAINDDDVITLKELNDFQADTSLTITDYNTNATYSNINNIIFRGQTVTVPGATANGVLAVDGGSNAVIVWIPAPSYVDFFNEGTAEISPISTTTRDLGDPHGDYDIGSWASSLNTPRPSINVSSISYTSTDFSVYDNVNTDLYFNFYGADGTTILASASYDLTSVGSVTSNGITINVTDFQTDQDKYKATATFVATFSSIPTISAGGRFSVELIHGNSADGTYSYTSPDIFYDADGASSNANIDIANGGTVSIQENNAELKWLSGIAYYDTDSTFTFSVTEIDNLNDQSFPQGTTNNSNSSTGHQLIVSPNNMAITTTNYFHGNDFTGWSQDYDIQSLAVSYIATVNQPNALIPNLDSSNNLLTANGSIDASIYDWGLVETENSPDYIALFDTQNNVSTDLIDQVGDEDKRLDLSNMTYNSGSWSQSAVLAGDALQVMFDRIVYPQHDFSGYYPQVNIDNARNYTSSGASSVSFDVYTNTASNPGTVTTVNFNDFRWYVSHFYVGLTSRKNGYFTFTANVDEADLQFQNATTGTPGDDELNILVGIDSSGSNTTPDKWLWISSTNGSNYPGRASAGTYNLDGLTKQIAFTLDGLNGVSRFWLLIGYNNSVAGKGLYISNITLVSPIP
jgi:hypothetical protein